MGCLMETPQIRSKASMGGVRETPEIKIKPARDV